MEPTHAQVLIAVIGGGALATSTIVPALITMRRVGRMGKRLSPNGGGLPKEQADKVSLFDEILAIRGHAEAAAVSAQAADKKADLALKLGAQTSKKVDGLKGDVDALADLLCDHTAGPGRRAVGGTDAE